MATAAQVRQGMPTACGSAAPEMMPSGMQHRAATAQNSWKRPLACSDGLQEGRGQGSWRVRKPLVWQRGSCYSRGRVVHMNARCRHSAADGHLI